MTDTLSPAERSMRMSLVRSRDTKPEMKVRRLIHSMGFRYRVQGTQLPGRPDLVFRSRNKVIFVHGCFWHRHTDSNCKLARMPKSRLDFWSPKLKRNHERDLENQQALMKLGWEYLVIWECEISKESSLRKRIWAFLES